MRVSLFAVVAVSAVATSAFFAAAPLYAQAPTTGLFAEAALSGTSVTVSYDGEDGDAQTGGGLDLRLGYGFTPRFAAYVHLGGASVKSDDPDVFGDAERFTMGNVELGVQASFPAPTRAFVPYLTLGLQGTALSADDTGGDILISGGGLALGGGVRFPLQPSLAVNLGLEGFGGSFTTLTVDGDDVEFDAVGLEDPAYRGGRLRVGLT